MSMKALLQRHSPSFALNGYREAVTWGSLARSRNKAFLRFAQPGHFYSPLPDIAGLEANAQRVFDRTTDTVDGLDLAVDAQLQRARKFAEFAPEMPFPEHATAGHRYHLDNEWFSYGDAVGLYSMMRMFEPRRVVEIGSGFSSAAMLDINERFFDGCVELTFVEPYPERLDGLLSDADRSRCTIQRSGVQDVPQKCFTDLEAGDFLFIDSSHVAKADSDVLHLLFRIIPLLKPGVVVHFHDMLWPFEYPESWIRQGRAWNEAYFVRAFLQYNDAFEILYFNSFLETRHRQTLADCTPLALAQPSAAATMGNSSLWIRRRS